MNILHLISSGGMYGAEAVILALSQAFIADGDQAFIASFGNASHQLHGRALMQSLPTCLLPCTGQFSPATLQAIRDTVVQHSIHLVHAHGYKADLYAWAALRTTGIALVSTCHTWYDNDLAVRVYGILDRAVLHRFHRVVAVSADVEQRLRRSRIPAARIHRIRNGIDLAPYNEIAERRAHTSTPALTVGLVGRLAPEKGIDLFLQAAATVIAAMPNTRFIVVGEGPERANLEQQIQTLHLSGDVTLLGQQHGMPDIYAGMDLLVSTSRQEGLPIALLEGMASGLPVVATAVGEVPTLVHTGQTGLLTPAGDVPAIAAAILQLLRDRDPRLRLGRQARTLIQQEFSLSRMAAEYRDVYREALGESRAQP